MYIYMYIYNHYIYIPYIMWCFKSMFFSHCLLVVLPGFNPRCFTAQFEVNGRIEVEYPKNTVWTMVYNVCVYCIYILMFMLHCNCYITLHYMKYYIILYYITLIFMRNKCMLYVLACVWYVFLDYNRGYWRWYYSPPGKRQWVELQCHTQPSFWGKWDRVELRYIT